MTEQTNLVVWKRQQVTRMKVVCDTKWHIVIVLMSLLATLQAPVHAHSPVSLNQWGSCSIDGDDAYLHVLPASPTVIDTVRLAGGGVWPDSCIPTYRSHTIDGNQIRISVGDEYPLDVVCASVITPWEFTLDLASLPAGEYQTEVYISDQSDDLSPMQCATSSFSVMGQVASPKPPSLVYLPIVRDASTDELQAPQG